jgi:hypothetical protein
VRWIEHKVHAWIMTDRARMSVDAFDAAGKGA